MTQGFRVVWIGVLYEALFSFSEEATRLHGKKYYDLKYLVSTTYYLEMALYSLQLSFLFCKMGTGQ